MKPLAALKEDRAAKTDAIRAIVAKATSENRDLTEAEQSAFDAGKGDVERIEREIRNAEFLADVERRMDAEPVTEHAGGADLEARFSVGKALGEFAEHGRLTGAEAEYAAEYRSGRPNAIAMPVSCFLGEQRAVLTTTPVGGPGGNLVPTNLGALIDRNRPKLAVQTLGATVLSGLSGNLALPRLTGSGTAYWVPEHGEPTESDPTFDQISFTPHTIAGLYEVSRRMLLQAPQIETVLRDDIGFILRQALDSAAIQGGGSNQPTGILATTGVQVLAMGTNGGALTIDTAPTMIALLDAVDAAGNTGFFSNNKVKAAALKLKDGQTRPYGLPAVFAGEPVVFSNQVPGNLTKGTGTALSALIYGVWSDLVLAYWSNVDIVLNPYADSVSKKGGAWLHAFLDADVGVRHPGNFAVAKDVNA